MNKRGIYTAIVALMVMAIIGGAIFYLTNPLNEIKTDAETNAIIELNYEMQNARYLLDKAMSDALFDYVYAQAMCSSDVSGAGTDVQKYMQDAISRLGDCSAESISFSAGTAGATAIVVCEKEIKKGAELEFSVHIEKRFEFSKTVEAQLVDDDSNPATPDVCLVNVMDNQSGLCDIKQLIPGICP